jgi:hypothetical protein
MNREYSQATCNGQMPNNRINRSAERRCRSVPVALRAPAPGYAERWASR